MILSFIRTIILYLVLMAGMRLLGKRQIGQLEPSEFVVAMLIADLASIPMQNNGIPLLSGLVPILTILGLELTLSGLTMYSVRFRRLLCGKPVILMENGKMLQSNMRKTKVTLDELTGHLREKDVLDLSTVRYAILETSGNLSVFLQEDGALPVTIISDGKLLEDNLKKSGRDENWVKKTLRDCGARVEETWLLTVDEDGKVQFYKKDKNVK